MNQEDTSLKNYNYSLAQLARVGVGAVEYTISLKRVKAPTSEYPGYDTKQSDGEAPVILELWGMQSTAPLP